MEMRKNVEVRNSYDGDGDTRALRVFGMELIEKNRACFNKSLYRCF